VTLGSWRETGILAHCPWAEWVHEAIRTSQERRNASHEVEVLKTFDVFFSIYLLDVEQLGVAPWFGKIQRLMFYVERLISYVYVFEIWSHVARLF
jgi:hypothetical protein